METWKKIDFLDNRYSVSNLGRVRRNSYVDAMGRPLKSKIMKGRMTTNGSVQLNTCKNGKNKAYLVHRLVAYAFISENCDDYQVRHKDGNKKNNCVENLFLLRNCEEKGEYISSSKMTNKDVLMVRQLSKQGKSNISISKIYGVNKTTIGSILNGRSWSHVE